MGGIVYVESGKWNCSDKRICEDHKKLVQLCIDGEEELFKMCDREALNRKYIGFGINIAGENIYLLVSRVKIPFEEESAEEGEKFIHALLTLQVNIFIYAKLILCLLNTKLIFAFF